MGGEVMLAKLSSGDVLVLVGDALVLMGDILIIAGLVLSYRIYHRERADLIERDTESVLAMLEAMRDGIRAWADPYFTTGYDEQGASERAQGDYKAVMDRSYGQLFRVPTEPLVALIERSVGGSLLRKETVEAANIALWRMGVFNQLVQQQTDFNARHLSEIYDPALPEAQRRALADGARAISTMLHASVIGDATWYKRLKAELETNIQALRKPLEHGADG
jgi:hypothetical protein